MDWGRDRTMETDRQAARPKCSRSAEEYAGSKSSADSRRADRKTDGDPRDTRPNSLREDAPWFDVPPQTYESEKTGYARNGNSRGKADRDRIGTSNDSGETDTRTRLGKPRGSAQGSTAENTDGRGHANAETAEAASTRGRAVAADGSGNRPFRIFTGDRVLWIIVAALAVISVLVVYSSTAKMAYDAHTVRTTSHFLRQQVMILAVSLGLMIAVHKINCRVYNHLAVSVYALSVLLTVAVYFIGATTNGAARWIPIGPFQFQPSEALKVATVLFLARQLAGRQSKIDKIRIVPSWRFWTWWSSPAQRRIWREGTVPILLPVLISCLVIFPAHTSSAVLVFAASWVMMLIGRVRIGELLKLVGWASAGIVLIMAFNLGRSETAEGRVSTWIHLWTRSQTEKPIEHLTDTERSMIAIHNGGILGEGAGQSAIRVEMIHPESDYAYAFFVEEYGIILAAVLLMLYLWIFFRAIEIFRRCGTAFPGLLVLGLALLITCQALLHIMVTVNLIPETGQTLPLISRGGSSVLFTTIALGMILSVSRQNDEQSHDTPKNESIYEK